jgi:hypothetical protein
MENENENENKDINKDENKKKIFVPPTQDEFVQFFLDNEYPKEYAIQAFNGYAVAEWHDSQGKKIKNWKQKAIHVWFKEEKKVKTYNHNKEYTTEELDRMF